MPEFHVEIANTRTDFLVVTVTANTAAEAEEVAMEELMSGDNDWLYGAKWNEGPSDYTAKVVTLPLTLS